MFKTKYDITTLPEVVGTKSEEVKPNLGKLKNDRADNKYSNMINSYFSN